MNSRERLTAVLKGEMPDCVPVAPDTSNMIPVRRTGKPFWDIYLYQDPPVWKAYIDTVKHFGFDSLMDGYAWIDFADVRPADEKQPGDKITNWIVHRDEEKIVTRSCIGPVEKGGWVPKADVYFRANPPVQGVTPEKAGVPEKPSSWEPVEGIKAYPRGEDLLKMVKEEMGDHGLVGVDCGTSMLIHNEKDLYAYMDDPKPFLEKRDILLDYFERKFRKFMSLNVKPDFICTGGSGTLIFQTVGIFRELALPIVKRITRLCKEHGIPSHIHSCGPEAQLVKIAAEETDLTVIDPLEIPPMGNCDLAELKKKFGDRLVLKGNLHTTDVMLKGSPDDVRRASGKAIDDAAKGGRFILSTGDQCGRDTPDENIFAMIETARTYGRY